MAKNNKKVNYKSSLEHFMKFNFPSEKLDTTGRDLISELLSNVNSLLISHIETEYSSIHRVNRETFHRFARNAIDKNFPEELKENALSEAYKQLALLQSGCLVYGEDSAEVKGKAEVKRRSTQEEIELKRNEVPVRLFKKGIAKMFSIMCPKMQVDSKALGPMAICIHGFGKMVAERASERAGQKEELQPLDLKQVLPEYFGESVLRVAAIEGNRCLALYENGLLEFKPKKTYESGWSQENIASEKIFSTVFKPGIQALAKEIAPSCKTESAAEKYLGLILMDTARYLAQHTSETCRKENISGIKDIDISQSVAETFPKELKQHAQLNGRNDVMDFQSGLTTYESKSPTQSRSNSASSRAKPKKEAKKSAPTTPKRQAKDKKSSSKSPKRSPTSRGRKSSESPKRSSTSRGRKSSGSPKRSPASRKRKSSRSPKHAPASKKRRSKSPPKGEKISREVAEKIQRAREVMSQVPQAPSVNTFANISLDRETESSVKQFLEETCNVIIDISASRTTEDLGVEHIESAIRELFPPEMTPHALVTAYNAISLLLEEESG